MTGGRTEAAVALKPLTLHMMAVFRARQRIADALCLEHGLTMAQMTALFRLWEQECCSMSDLQVQLSLTTGAVTGVVDRLETLGLVERFASPDDRRFCFARLTPAGLERAQAIGLGWERHLEAWLEQIPGETRLHAVEAFGAMALVSSAVPEAQAPEHRGTTTRRKARRTP
jgi:DNA-binding MarR family transcriptional regulator